MSEEKIKVGLIAAVDKSTWWKTKIEFEELGYLELHPGNIPAVGDNIIVKSDNYKVISRSFITKNQNWAIILKKQNT